MTIMTGTTMDRDSASFYNVRRVFRRVWRTLKMCCPLSKLKNSAKSHNRSARARDANITWRKAVPRMNQDHIHIASRARLCCTHVLCSSKYKCKYKWRLTELTLFSLSWSCRLQTDEVLRLSLVSCSAGGLRVTGRYSSGIHVTLLPGQRTKELAPEQQGAPHLSREVYRVQMFM